MMHLYKNENGNVVLHVDTKTAAKIGSALIQARPQGSIAVDIDGVTLFVHVHGGKQSEPSKIHVPVEVL